MSSVAIGPTGASIGHRTPVWRGSRWPWEWMSFLFCQNFPPMTYSHCGQVLLWMVISERSQRTSCVYYCFESFFSPPKIFRLTLLVSPPDSPHQVRAPVFRFLWLPLSSPADCYLAIGCFGKCTVPPNWSGVITAQSPCLWAGHLFCCIYTLKFPVRSGWG